MTLEQKEDAFQKLLDELKTCVAKAEARYQAATCATYKNNLRQVELELDCLPGFWEELEPMIEALREAYKDEAENPRCYVCGAPQWVSTEGGQGEEKGCSHW